MYECRESYSSGKLVLIPEFKPMLNLQRVLYTGVDDSIHIDWMTYK